MTARACIACDATGWTDLWRGLQRCDRCGFVTARELPAPAELERIYAAGYFEGGEYADYAGDRAVHEENFERRFARITATAGRLESLYEVGCAHGFWLATAARHGVRAAGIDLSADAVRHAAELPGVQAACGDFADAPLEPGAWQAFCMWDTLEHLAHPEAYVAKITALLPAGGWFFATTGDIGAPVARRQGEGWRMIHPPTHLQYFSRETLGRFLGRHGLRVEHVETVPMCRSLHGALAGLERFGHGPVRAAARLVRALTPAPLAKRIRFSVDLGDIMLACARKA